MMMKEGYVMKADFTFIDQTLGYALEKQSMDTSEFLDIKRKIAAISHILFDLSLKSFMTVLYDGVADTKDIRVCIQPDAGQVEQVHQLGCDHIKITITHDAVKKMPVPAAAALRQAQAREMTVALHITGGCQYSAFELRRLDRTVKKYDIHSIVFDDERGELDPIATYQNLLEFQQAIPCLVEYYGKNRLGLVTGNAIGAIQSGVRCLAVSVGGVAGYPALEEVLMGALYLLKFPLAVPNNLAACCEEILHYLGHSVHTTKPIIGSSIFAHESGIHVDGVNKKSDLYEPFTPETVGLSRKIIIGKHSGKASIEFKLKEMNIFIHPVVVQTVLEKVRSLAIWQKAPVSDVQLLKLVHEAAS